MAVQRSKLNVVTAKIVADAVRRGHSLRKAAAYAEVDHATVLNWLKSSPTFRRRVEKADADYLDALVRPLPDAAELNPGLALKIAGIKDPDGWAERNRHEVSGPEGGALKVELQWVAGPTPGQE